MTSDQTENEKGGFASKLLPFIKKQTRSFKENYFCKRIRLGVTGLSKLCRYQLFPIFLGMPKLFLTETILRGCYRKIRNGRSRQKRKVKFV